MKALRHLPRFREAYRTLPLLEERETWPRERLEAFQLDKLNELWGNAVETVPYYQSLRASKGLPASFESLAQFKELTPVLSKQQVRDTPGEFQSSVHRSDHVSRTSGSTGVPLVIRRSSEDHRRVLQARYRLYQSWGIDILDRCVFLWGAEQQMPHWWQNQWKLVRRNLNDWLRSRLRLYAYNLSQENQRRHLDRIDAFRPAMMYGFSNALYLLAKEALASGFTCDSIRLVVCTSEVVTPHMIDTIRRAFSCEVISEYGATECELIAGQAPDGTLRVREDLVFAEATPREDGRHDVLITVLDNRSFPLIRYAIEDVTDQPLTYPDNGFAILSNLAGRDDDVAFASSGQPIHPAQIHSVFERLHTAVRQYKVHQTTDGAVHVCLQPVAELKLTDLNLLRNRLKSLFKDHAVNLEVVPQVALTAAGKHRVITSDIKKPVGHGLQAPVNAGLPFQAASTVS